MNDVMEMLQSDHAERASRAQRNRYEANAHGMQWVGDVVDLLRANGFPSASVAYMEDGQGWSKGKRDPGPWATYLPNGVKP